MSMPTCSSSVTSSCNRILKPLAATFAGRMGKHLPFEQTFDYVISVEVNPLSAEHGTTIREFSAFCAGWPPRS